MKTLDAPFSRILLTLGLLLGISATLRAECPIPKHVVTTPAAQTFDWAKSWWIPRHEQKIKEVKDCGGDIDLVFLGDSITHGWEKGGKEIWNQYYANRKALNLGFGGDRIEQVLWRIDHGAFDGMKPKLTVLLIGVNNINQKSSTPEQKVDGIRAILKRLEAKQPEMKILLLAVFPWGPTADCKKREGVNAINQYLPKLADGDRVFYLDIGNVFLEEDGTLPKSVMPDLLHPNAKGYTLWAEAIEPTVKKLLGEQK